METEKRQSPDTNSIQGGQSTNADTAAAKPSNTTGVAAQPSGSSGTKRSTLVLGSVAFLALGMLLGIGATKHIAGIASAAAAPAKSRTNTPPSAASPTPNLASPAAWNPFQELRDMQLHMDRMFDDMNTQFRLEPRLSVFADNPSYSLSLGVQDLKDHFEVRAYLPNAKASDVSVSLLDKQTLKVEVSNKTTAAPNKKDPNEQITEWGQYAQVIRLPAPVKREEMKIDQAHHELLITLPKA